MFCFGMVDSGLLNIFFNMCCLDEVMVGTSEAIFVRPYHAQIVLIGSFLTANAWITIVQDPYSIRIWLLNILALYIIIMD